jgi:hypothetical protein
VQSGWFIEPVIKEKKTDVKNIDVNSEKITEKIIPSTTGEPSNDSEVKEEEVIHTLYDNPFMSAAVLRGMYGLSRNHSTKKIVVFISVFHEFL